MSKWLVTLPPEGAARQVGENFFGHLIRQLGKENVLLFDCLTYLSAYRQMLKDQDEDMVVDLLNQSMTVKSIEFGTTHLLVLALCPITLFTLNLHKKMGVKNLHWFYEDYRLASYWKDVLPGYQGFLAVQKGDVEKECQRLSVTFKYLPTGTTPHEGLLTGAESLRSTDVAFVGIPSPYRTAVLESLAAAGVKVKVAGSGWDTYQGPLKDFIISGKWVNSNETRQILTGAKIGLNMSLNSPESDKENTQISPRAYDIVDSNCLLVTENVPLVKESLGDIKYLTFDSHNDAVEVVKKGLDNFKSYQKLFARNKDIIHRMYSYTSRAAEIISLGESL